jgi:hypothetical protein
VKPGSLSAAVLALERRHRQAVRCLELGKGSIQFGLIAGQNSRFFLLFGQDLDLIVPAERSILIKKDPAANSSQLLCYEL